MPASGAIRAGRAFVELFADDSQLVRGLKRAQEKLRAFGESVTRIGAGLNLAGGAVAGALLAAVGKFAESGGQLAKLSAQTGASVEELSRLRAVAGRLSIEHDDLTGSIEELNIRLGETIRDGVGPAAEAFKQLGLDAGELADMPLTERFGAIADALAGIQNQAMRGFLADEIFGGDAFKILPMLRLGSKGMRDMIDQAEKLGLVMDQGQAEKAAEFSRVWNDLKQTASALAGQIGGVLAPALTTLLTNLRSVSEVIVKWMNDNRQLVLLVAGIAGGLLAAGTVLIGLGGAASLAATALGGIVTILGALLSPVALVTGAITGLTTWILTATDTGSQALDWLGARFEDLKNTALAAWQGIGDALAAGDIGLAAKILWLTLKMEWKKGVHALNQLWVKVKEFFLSTWTEAVFGAARIATNAWAGLQAGWTQTVDFLRDAWLTFTTFLAKNWNRVVGFIKGAWQKLKSAVTGKDTSAIQKQIAEETARMNEDLDTNRNQEIAAREQSRKQRLSEIESERTGALSELEERREAEHVARQKAFASDLAGTEAALEEARKEWQAATEEAAKANKASGEDGGRGSQSPLPELEQRLQFAGSATISAQKSLAAVDASSSEGLALFAAASRGSRLSPDDQTAKNTEKLVEQQKQANTTLERIERKTQTPKVAKLSGS